MTRQLRDYQRDAVDAVRAEHARGVLRTAIILPTGAGKTDCIAALATDTVRRGGRVLAICHLMTALTQIADRCRMHFPEYGHALVGRVQGEVDQRNRPIVVGSVPTLRQARRRDRIEPYGPNDLVIIDECHHAASAGQLDILRWAGAFESTPTFGVTATMYQTRKSGPQLGDVWQSVAFERDIAWAIGEGWLVKPRGLSVVLDHLDLSKAKSRGGDFADGDVGEMVAQDADQVVAAWIEHGENRITAAFVPTVDAAKEWCAAFDRAGVAAELVTEQVPHRERGDAAAGTGIYGRLARGETRVVVSVAALLEAWDCPQVSCILWGRPTQVDGVYIQGIGRGLRPSPGKTDCLVLDAVGVTRHRKLRVLPDLIEGAEYAEIRPQSCARCGKYRTPPDRFDPRCVCPPVERDPLGGRVELVGPARYEPVDLFGEEVAETADPPYFLWLKTRGGIAFVPAKDRIVALTPEPGGTWRAGHVHRDRFERGVRLASGATLREAKCAAEEWAEGYCEPTYWARRAPWRRAGNPPSEGQVRAAKAQGMADPERHSRAAVSDFLSVRAASRRLDRK